LNSALIEILQFSIAEDISEPLGGFWELMSNHGSGMATLSRTSDALIAGSLLIVSVGAFYVFDRRQQENGNVFPRLRKAIAVFASIVHYSQRRIWRTN